MKAYKYNSDNIYVGEQECQLNPIASQREGKEVWLLPANCTFISPLDAKDGFNVVWTDTAWEYVEISTNEVDNTDNTETVDSTPTFRDRLEALEEAVSELAEMLAGGAE